MIEKYDFTIRHSKKRLKGFADYILNMQNQIGFKVSSRGWCYQLEQAGFIDKSQFQKVEGLINKCRKNGLLPIDFVAEEEGRRFSVLENPTPYSYSGFVDNYISQDLRCEYAYEPEWWEGEEYYIQMIVEKIDLKTLFLPTCKKYHIPIATSKGWSSITQRAEYARRFKEAEEEGKVCVLLYCGDHDPDGIRIADNLRKNLTDIENIRWGDGGGGYNPDGLIIERFGLSYEFIKKHNLTWIDNLITGSGKNLASPHHRNYRLTYLQNYLKQYGERKCEANSIVTMPTAAENLVVEAIESYLGENALSRFAAKKNKVVEGVRRYKEKTGIQAKLEEIKEILDKN